MTKPNSNRPRASRNAYAGYHQFKGDGGDYGSFEVFYVDRGDARAMTLSARDGYGPPGADDTNPYRAGWYWQSCFPGCMPDSDPNGPYTSSQAAYRNAQEDC